MPVDIAPNAHLPPPAGEIIVYGLHLALPAAALLLMFGRYLAARRRARLADRSFDPGAPLAEGPAVLHGKVVIDDPSGVAVRVAIDMNGEERPVKNGWAHTWREVARRVEVAPFALDEDRGVRVRVEPDADVLLVDRVDRREIRSRYAHTRIAELSSGEEVYVTGELVKTAGEAGYRTAASDWVLRSPVPERMLVAAEPLGERFRGDARQQRNFALATMVATICFQSADLGFHMRVHRGVVGEGTITSRKRVNNKNPRCEIKVTTPDGGTLTETVSLNWCSAPVSQVPVLYVPGEKGRFAQVGTVPTAFVPLGLIALMVFVAIFVFYRTRSRPWYEEKIEEQGGGRLPEVSPASR